MVSPQRSLFLHTANSRARHLSEQSGTTAMSPGEAEKAAYGTIDNKLVLADNKSALRPRGFNRGFQQNQPQSLISAARFFVQSLLGFGHFLLALSFLVRSSDIDQIGS
ncbi:hypothetical protein [Teredinibacter turnerae]|uniref:hypothetical protein n=2 Tax=Teredinibacter turnerae TaxID=2426 RepID=UPI001E5D9E1E|nr:hypothetical protein [Teredinibacter turnerae]